MAELSELMCCSSSLAFKNQLLRRPKEHHSFILKLSRHDGKTTGSMSLKNRNGFGLHIIVILFTLIFDGSEIIQYSYRGIGQPHVIP